MSLKKILVGNASCHDFSCICWASPLIGHRFGNGQLSSNGMQRSVAVKNPFLQHVRWDDADCLSENISGKTRMPTSPSAFTHIPAGCCHPKNNRPLRSDRHASGIHPATCFQKSLHSLPSSPRIYKSLIFFPSCCVLGIANLAVKINAVPSTFNACRRCFRENEIHSVMLKAGNLRGYNQPDFHTQGQGSINENRSIRECQHAIQDHTPLDIPMAGHHTPSRYPIAICTSRLHNGAAMRSAGIAYIIGSYNPL